MMQGAKDSFYMALRDRIASINPERTMVERGVTRPSAAVAENEIATTTFAADVFWLRWTGLAVDPSDGLERLECEITYGTDGSAGSGGMDRGRALAQMDLELAMALRRDPQHTTETEYTSAGATTLLTAVFWGDPVFGRVATAGERVSRVATVAVFGYGESGEL